MSVPIHYFPGNICSTNRRGNLGIINGTATTSWMQYRYNFTSTISTHTIIFGFDLGNNDRYLLDNVSIRDATNGTGAQLLMNPSFESSSSTIPNWSVLCSSGCGANAAKVVSGSACVSGTGNCVDAQCSSNTELLSQSFITTPGKDYSISFQMRLIVSGGSGGNRLYIDIY